VQCATQELPFCGRVPGLLRHLPQTLFDCRFGLLATRKNFRAVFFEQGGPIDLLPSEFGMFGHRDLAGLSTAEYCHNANLVRPIANNPDYESKVKMLSRWARST